MFANAPQLPVDTQFFGPNRFMLDAVGRFNVRLQWRDRQSTRAIYVIRDVHQPLLGRDAIVTLGAAVSLVIVNTAGADTRFDSRVEYADRFTGLGRMPGNYKIPLKLDAVPFAIYTPRRVPVNLVAPLNGLIGKSPSSQCYKTH
jgi:hypothetical protein